MGIEEDRMAGKSNKGRNRKGSHNNENSSETATSASSDVPSKDSLPSLEPPKAVVANGDATVSEANVANSEVKESNNANPENQGKQGKVADSVILLFLFIGLSHCYTII